MFVKKLYVFIVCFSTVFGFAQTPKLDSLNKKYNYFLEKNYVDSLFFLCKKFRERKDLSNLELFYSQYSYSKALIETHFYKGALAEIAKCETILDKQTPNYKALIAKINEAKAGCYFSLGEGNTAFKFAAMAEFDLDSFNYSQRCENAQILGYKYLNEKNYEKSKYYFNKALWVLPDSLPFIGDKTNAYSKLIVLHATLQDAAKVNAYKDSVTKLLPKNNNINSQFLFYHHLANSYVEIKEFKQAYYAYLKRDEFRDTLAKNILLNKVLVIEERYDAKLKNQENKSLLALNQQSDKTIKQQKSIIAIVVIAIILLLFFIYYIYKISKQRAELNKKLEDRTQQIEKNNQEFKRLNVLNQKIFTVLSHDFKTPISIIQVMLNQPEIKNSDNEKLNYYINDLVHQLEQSNSILDNLLDWGRMEISAESQKIINLSLVHPSIVSLSHQLSNQLSAKGLVLKNLVPENFEINLPPKVTIIVLRNLIANAIKYSYKNQEIIIYTEGKNVCVKDTGTGMSEERLQNIFKNQVLSTLGTNIESGYGIGLYLSNELLHKYNGFLSAESELNKGSVFSICTKQ